MAYWFIFKAFYQLDQSSGSWENLKLGKEMKSTEL